MSDSEQEQAVKIVWPGMGAIGKEAAIKNALRQQGEIAEAQKEQNRQITAGLAAIAQQAEEAAGAVDQLQRQETAKRLCSHGLYILSEKLNGFVEICTSCCNEQALEAMTPDTFAEKTQQIKLYLKFIKTIDPTYLVDFSQKKEYDRVKAVIENGIAEFNKAVDRGGKIVELFLKDYLTKEMQPLQQFSNGHQLQRFLESASLVNRNETEIAKLEANGPGAVLNLVAALAWLGLLAFLILIFMEAILWAVICLAIALTCIVGMFNIRKSHANKLSKLKNVNDVTRNHHKHITLENPDALRDLYSKFTWTAQEGWQGTDAYLNQLWQDVREGMKIG